MGYSRDNTITINFSEWDEPDLWVELRRCSEMPYTEYLDIWVSPEVDQKQGRERSIVKKIAAMVVAWNLPDSEGNILPIPSVDPESITKVRTRHAEYISQTLIADARIMADLDLVSRTETS